MRAKLIQELVGIVEKSNIDEIEVTRWWGQKVRIRKSASPATAPRFVTASATPVASEPLATPAHVVPPAAGQVTATPIETNYIEIKAPMVGTFYRAPSPGVSPYVHEGDIVSKGQVLCIIEAMKLMNELEADVSGRIVKVLADNSQPIEYNQPLFLIDPS
ncbi:acetyl-CoA carboxylase biotin carboxyl carrier protein [candidate division KSB1 bacterium]|nr:acetyl-CoA carboxylase biotin carboxyl carrier protein [candidate division KSB1 bacterium]